MTTLWNPHNQNPLSSDSELDREEQRRLMNELVGLESKPNHQGEFVLPPPDEFTPQDPVTRKTNPKIWERGTTHLLFIGGSVALVGLILATLYNSFVGTRPTEAKKEQPKSSQEELFKTPGDSELGQWKTEAALSEQRNQLQSLDDLKNVVPNDKTSTPVTITEAQKPSPAQTQPRPSRSLRHRASGRSAAPPTHVVRYTPAPAPIRPQFNPPFNPPIVRSQPVLPQQPRQFTAQVSDPKDALAMLDIASSAGIYSTGRSTSPRTPAISAASEGQPSRSRTRQTRTSIGSGTVPITTRVAAKVTTAIAWTGDKTNQKFRIQLSEPMLTDDGSTVLPKGTLFLAQVEQADMSGYINVSLISAYVNGQDIPIPPDTLIVQNPNGEPLQASVKNPRATGAGRAIGLALLSGVSNAAKAANPTTIVTSGNTSTVSNNDPDIGAAAVEGFTNSLVKTGTSRFEKSLNRPSQGQPVLLLKSGTKLEIFVNQPFSI